MSYEIEKGIKPTKKNYGNHTSKYPFAIMKVNDSFFVPAEMGQSPQKVQKTVAVAVCTHRKNNKDLRFQTEQTEKDGVKGVRVFRIA